MLDKKVTSGEELETGELDAVSVGVNLSEIGNRNVENLTGKQGKTILVKSNRFRSSSKENKPMLKAEEKLRTLKGTLKAIEEKSVKL